jgi:hypothetical protein
MDVTAEDCSAGAGKSGIVVVVVWDTVTAGICYEEKSRQPSLDSNDAD